MMRDSKKKGKKTRRPKMKLGLPDLDQAKSAVLNSLRSPESERGYQHSDEFIGWYCSESRFTPLREHFRGRADGSCDTSNGTSIPSPSSVLPAWSSPCLEGEESPSGWPLHVRPQDPRLCATFGPGRCTHSA